MQPAYHAHLIRFVQLLQLLQRQNEQNRIMGNLLEFFLLKFAKI